MTFISYAQNFEDIMLWRALKHIKEGFYIDVGANDPDIDTVTRAFYDRGWRGINIEPVHQWFDLLEEKRPRDINLQVAVGAEAGEMVLYVIPDTGLSTNQLGYAVRHEMERGYTKREIRVPVETLTAICGRFPVDSIHFLKIDVEGAEKEVLEGIDFSQIRPWIVLVEATLPNSPQEDHFKWESILLSADYSFAYFDGLNRYYVAREHGELNAAFHSPPNVFDNFVNAQQVKWQLRAQCAETRIAELETQLIRTEEQASEAEARALAAKADLASAGARVTAAEARIANANAEERSAEVRARKLEAQLAEAEARAASDARLLEAESKVVKLEAELNAALAANHSHWQLAETRLQHIQAIYLSESWRLTAPLRWTITYLKGFRVRKIKSYVKGALQYAARYVLARPRLKGAAVAVFGRTLLRNLWLRSNSVSGFPPHVTASQHSIDSSQLTPRARNIYGQLKEAIRKKVESC